LSSARTAGAIVIVITSGVITGPVLIGVGGVHGPITDMRIPTHAIITGRPGPGRGGETQSPTTKARLAAGLFYVW
jgi:hypothetical protein